MVVTERKLTRGTISVVWLPTRELVIGSGRRSSSSDAETQRSSTGTRGMTEGKRQRSEQRRSQDV
jgi:hypothetical protein